MSNLLVLCIVVVHIFGCSLVTIKYNDQNKNNFLFIAIFCTDSNASNNGHTHRKRCGLRAQTVCTTATRRHQIKYCTPQHAAHRRTHAHRNTNTRTPTERRQCSHIKFAHISMYTIRSARERARRARQSEGASLRQSMCKRACVVLVVLRMCECKYSHRVHSRAPGL